MPVHLDRDPSSHSLSLRVRFGFDPGLDVSRSGFIHIGLINNMPDGALEATERQFLTVLGMASENAQVLVSLYSLPGVFRTDSGRRYLSRSYSDIENLWDSPLDGLIVTGTEPRAPSLTDEPYWRSLTRVIDWADRNTRSAVWSCLAAQAAVLHVDGIPRHPMGAKRFGIFECAQASGHALNAGILSPARSPHSRWNDLWEADLADCGYQMLTRSNDGIDSFVKRRNSLFVFFQGHPEYEAESLLLEYLRDIRRYIKGERAAYPELPRNYFDQGATAAFGLLRERALSKRSEELLTNCASVTALGTRIVNTWRPHAVRVYRNWLRYLQTEKERRSRETPRRNRSAHDADLGVPLRAAEA